MKKPDDRFPPLEELQMANLFPAASAWPTYYEHQKKLVAARDEGEAIVREAFAKIAEIDAAKDFTPEARARKRAELAAEYITKLEESAARRKAEEAGAEALEKYQEKINIVDFESSRTLVRAREAVRLPMDRDDLSAEIAEATRKATRQAEAGWQRAIDLILERAARTKLPSARAVMFR
jgi:hypothetical protein